MAVHLILSCCLLAEADLRIGELQWGDSGVYFCKVVIADDLEGVNEGQLELLVLGAYHLRLISSLKEQHELVPGVDCWLQFSLFVLLMLVCLHVQLSEASPYWFTKVLEMSFFLPACQSVYTTASMATAKWCWPLMVLILHDRHYCLDT